VPRLELRVAEESRQAVQPTASLQADDGLQKSQQQQQQQDDSGFRWLSPV